MLFDFRRFLDELRENPEKKEIVEKYEKYFGTIVDDVRDQLWYREYVSTFPFVDYSVPEELRQDFDWELLMQLVAASFSSDGLLAVSDNADAASAPDFVISVQSGDQLVVKKMSELRWFQVLRLYDIYIEEQMNLQILLHEEEKEKEAILSQREQKQQRWKLVLDNWDKEKMKGAYEKEKEAKLGDLMNQL